MLQTSFTLAVFLAIECFGQSSPPAKARGSTPADQSRAAYDRANALFEEKRLNDSVAALDEALAADPRNVPALTLKAKIAISAKRFDIAGDCLQRAVTADPSSWYARFLYGFWYYLRNDSENALKELKLARTLNPKDARAPLYLGMTYERLGEVQKPLLFYREALRIEEGIGNPDPHTLLAYSRFLFSSGRLDECTAILNRALKLYPGMRNMQYEIGRLWLKKGEAQLAVNAGEAALLLPPDDDAPERQIRYLLARAYKAAGNDSEAAKQTAAMAAAERPTVK